MIRINLSSSVPLEEQVRSGIREAIAREKVVPGDVLPSVRQLAGDLGIHWNTVARAYRRMRDEGLLTGGRGRRVIVRECGATAVITPGIQDRVLGRLREALTEARLGGLRVNSVKKLLSEELRNWPKSGATPGRLQT
jgi:DNA-binding transcriptional regulator YhcF (GntR family)